jgi:uncharacterized protein YqeY
VHATLLCSVRSIRSVLRRQGLKWQQGRLISHRNPYSQGLYPSCARAFTHSFQVLSLLTHSLAQLDSADQFNQASRPDLAAKERQEADFLAKFLPPLLPEAEIDRILKGVIISQRVAETQVDDPRRSIGKVFKTFYAKVDRASVDPDLVRRRAEALLAAPPFA